MKLNKYELIENIQDKHRQLLRYVFYFAKDEDGQFSATDRPKFGLEEMLQPGVVGSWSLKDLLADLLNWEQQLIRWIGSGQDDFLATDIASTIPDWDETAIDGRTRPELAESSSLQEILTRSRTQYHDVIRAVETIPEEELFIDGAYRWAGQKSAAKIVALCTYDHYDWAKKLIRKWRRTHAGEYLNRQVVLERIREERQRLDNNLNSLTIDQRQQPGVVGEWSIKDLLAHLADWEQRFIGWYQAGLQGELPDVPAPGITWANIDTLNHQIYKTHRDRSLDEVTDWYDTSYNQLLDIVKGIPEDDIFTPGLYPWLGTSNLVSYILANSANHYRWANQQIRNWQASQDIKD